MNHFAFLLRIVPDAGVREALLQLAEEEARHMVRFEREYEKLTANEK
jgi:rubrerythrin